MGCHIYAYDRDHRDMAHMPFLRVPAVYEGQKFQHRVDACRFLDQLKLDLDCPNLSPEQVRDVLVRHWRQEAIAQRERDAVNIEWLYEFVCSPQFGRLECG